MSVGDQFPLEEKEAFLNRTLIPGTILYLFCEFTSPPKFKYGILACIDPEPILLIINSEISSWLQQRPAMRDCQVTLRQEEYSFLRHDSFVDCTKAIRVFALTDLKSQLLEDLDRIKGQITRETREAIVYAVKTGNTIENRIKLWIIQALAGNS